MTLLLHGFAGDPGVWTGIVDDGHAIWLPGHGGAPIHDTWEENLAALPDDDLAIGYSLGARVALGLVARNKVARAILVGVNPRCDDRPARRASDAAWAARLRRDGTAAFLDAWQQQPLFSTQARFPDRVAARRARRERLDPEGLARSLETMGLAAMPDLTHAVSDARVTLVAGALDAKYVAIARALSPTVHLVADSGHDPTLEQPVALAALLARLRA